MEVALELSKARASIILWSQSHWAFMHSLLLSWMLLYLVIFPIRYIFLSMGTLPLFKLLRGERWKVKVGYFQVMNSRQLHVWSLNSGSSVKGILGWVYTRVHTKPIFFWNWVILLVKRKRLDPRSSIPT
jgi:hypothetical protein